MKEIRLHGRGGQGVAIAAEILAGAFIIEGKHAAAFPMFGAERRGAPVMAFVRFDDRPVLEKTQVYAPDCLIVTDPVMWTKPAIYAGLKPGGILVANAALGVRDDPEYREGAGPRGGKRFEYRGVGPNVSLVGSVDATRIALKEVGIPVTNTCLLGAFARATGWLKMDSLLQRMRDYFQGEGLEKNMKAIARGYEEVETIRQAGKPVVPTPPRDCVAIPPTSRGDSL